MSKSEKAEIARLRGIIAESCAAIGYRKIHITGGFETPFGTVVEFDVVDPPNGVSSLIAIPYGMQPQGTASMRFDA